MSTTRNKTFLFRKVSGSLTMYSIPFFSKLVSPSTMGFLGSKLSNPPAMITIGAWCSVPSIVVTTKDPSSCFSIVSALSP
jgi:hypothetical protein